MLAKQKSHAETWKISGRLKPLTWRAIAENEEKASKPTPNQAWPALSPPPTSPAGTHPFRVADSVLLRLGNIISSGKDVFKFSEHFPLALSICSYHSGVRAWQGLELTYTKLCMSWSQPQWLCHCHVKLHHSWPLSACAHDTCQKLSSVCSFLHQDCLPSLDKEGMTFGMREEWAVPFSVCLLKLSVWVFSQHIKV